MNDNQQATASFSQAPLDGAGHWPDVSVESARPAGFMQDTICGASLSHGRTLGDVSYDRLRASEERTAALKARHPAVRRVHLELAERYEERVRQSILSSRSQLWL